MEETLKDWLQEMLTFAVFSGIIYVIYPIISGSYCVTLHVLGTAYFVFIFPPQNEVIKNYLAFLENEVSF